jgi:thymidine phosphorylase
MLFTDVIRTKRDGGELSDEQIRVFVDGLADESIPAEQVSALAMAIFLNSMSSDETASLTMAMASSGAMLEWQDVNGPVVDKHSTGGVGDKVSFMLAPVAAACGCHVPMISGRGLGHTAPRTRPKRFPGTTRPPISGRSSKSSETSVARLSARRRTSRRRTVACIRFATLRRPWRPSL